MPLRTTTSRYESGSWRRDSRSLSGKRLTGLLTLTDGKSARCHLGFMSEDNETPACELQFLTLLLRLLVHLRVKEIRMNTRVLAFALSFLLPSVAFAQTKSPVEGVWKIIEEVRTGPNPFRISNPQPSLVIFTRGGHYSWVNVMGNPARPTFEPAKDPRNLTDAEKIARYEQWRPFAANAGTYEIKGSTVTMRPIVAKNPNLMTREHRLEFKLEGRNTLWLIPLPDETATEPTIKLVRVE